MIKTFKIPAIPPSSNEILKLNRRTGTIYTSETVKSFRRNITPFIPPMEITSDEKVYLKVEYHGKFLNKDKTTKRRDGQNLDKVLYDTIFDKLGVDDKCVWGGSWTKHHSDSGEYTLVTIGTNQEEVCNN